MFARPRPKKSPLPPPFSKKRKVAHAIEEISFDNAARAEYLTGFHRRKLQRVKNAQEEAAKRARLEKIDARKQTRDDRRREVEEHVQNVSAILKEAARAGHIDSLVEESDQQEAAWEGVPDLPLALEHVDHEEEYIDEDKYTTVTVESVNVSRDGLVRPEDSDEDAREDHARQLPQTEDSRKKVSTQPKKKKSKFRYETKAERLLSSRKQKIKRLKSRA